MPSILRLRIDGWFSRCRGKVTRAAPEMFKRESHESQAPRVKPSSRERQKSVTPCSRESREGEICNWRVVFQQSNLLLPTGGLSNPMVRMGRSPAHVQACWVDQQFCDVSSLLGRINFIDLYTCIIMHICQKGKEFGFPWSVRRRKILLCFKWGGFELCSGM